MRRFFALFLAVVGLGDTVSALNLFDLSFSLPTKKLKQLDHIDPQVLTPHIGLKRQTELGTIIWRYSAVLHKDVVAHGQGANFTAIFAFPRDENDKLGYFSARPQTLLTEDASWYTDLSDRQISRVYAALRVPEKHPGDSEGALPLIVIDVECTGCSQNNVTVTFEPERAEWSSVRKTQIFYDFAARAPHEREVLAVTNKDPCAKGMNCWEFNSTAASLCGGPFDGAIQFYVDPATIRGNLYWRLSTREGTVAQYEAVLGVDGHDHIVRWSPNDQQELCEDPYSDISLQMTCEKCKVRRAAVTVPNEPEFPQGASPNTVAHLSTSWQDGGICSIDVATSPSGRLPAFHNDDIVRLWFDNSATDCPRRYTLVNEASRRFTLDWMEERKVRNWEKELGRTPLSLGRSFLGISRCLCEQLKGRVYRLVDWWSNEVGDNSNNPFAAREETGKPNAFTFKRNVDTGLVMGINPVDNLNIDGKLLKPVEEDQVVKARQDPANAVLWYLTANISAAAIRGAARHVVATFNLTTNEKGTIYGVFSPLRATGHLTTPYFDALKQTVEVTIKPQNQTYGGVVTNIDEALVLQLYCTNCTEVNSTVQFRFGRTLKDIEPQPLQVMSPPRVTKALSTWRFFSVIHEDILLRGGGTRFTAVFEFSNLGSGNLTVKPLSLLTKENAWYIESPASSKSVRVYAALQLPEAWNKTEPPKVIIDVACTLCSITKARLTYHPEPPEWSSVYKRQIYDLFAARKLTNVAFLGTVTKKRCTGGMDCWEISTVSDNLCSDTFDGVIQFYVDPKTINGSILWSLRPTNNDPVTSFKAVVGVHDSYHHIVSWNPEDRRLICKAPGTEVSLQLTCEGCIVVDPAVATFAEPEIPKDAIAHSAKQIFTTFWDEFGVCNIHANTSKATEFTHNTVVRLWPSLKHPCIRDMRKVASSSLASEWAQERSLQEWAMQVSKKSVRVGQAFSGFSKCDCQRLTGKVYSVVEWQPTGSEKNTREHDMHSTSDYGAILAATGRTEYGSHFELDRSVEFDQEIKGLKDPNQKDRWQLVANMSIPDIECAKTHVTATFTLVGDTKNISSVNIPFLSTGRWNAPHYDKVNGMVQITLKPQLPSQQKCPAELHEVLPLEVICKDCAEIRSVVRFTLGRVIEDIDPQPLTPMCPRKIFRGRPPTWRFFTVVDKEIVARGKGTQFTAIFKFPVWKKFPEFNRFAARPRTFLTTENAWYATVDTDSEAILVYAALEVPDYRESSANHFKKIIIDVECERCKVREASLTYREKNPAWQTIKKVQIYKEFWRRSPVKMSETMERSRGMLCTDKSICREFTTKVKTLCSGAFDGAARLVITPKYSKPHFQWRVSRMNVTDYPAEVGTDGLGAYSVGWSSSDARRICRDPNAAISLRLICDDCTVGSIELYRPKLPEVPHGTSSLAIAEIAGTGDRGGNCQIKALETGPTTAVSGDIPRLWSQPSNKCSDSDINPSFADKRLDWLTKHKVRNWEALLAKSPKFLGLSVPHVSKCACEGIRGEVYRRVDWGRVTPESDKDDNIFCNEDEADDMAAKLNASATPDQTSTNNLQKQEVNGKPTRSTAKFAGLYAERKAVTGRYERSKLQELRTENDKFSEGIVDAEKDGYEADILPDPELDTLPNIDSDDSVVEGAIFSSLLEIFPQNATGRQQGNRMLFDSLVQLEKIKLTPFVAAFCLLTKKSASITSVTFWNGFPIESFPGPENSTIMCYAYDSCSAWEALAAFEDTKELPSLDIVVTGVNLPRKLLWRVDDAVEVEDYPSVEHRYNVSSGGWYGTMEQLSKYKRSSNFVEVTVESKLPSRCHRLPDVSALHGVKEATKGAKSQELSFGSRNGTSFVYVRPKFQLFPTETIFYSGDWQTFRSRALTPAFLFIFIALIRYDQH